MQLEWVRPAVAVAVWEEEEAAVVVVGEVVGEVELG